MRFEWGEKAKRKEKKSGKKRENDAQAKGRKIGRYAYLILLARRRASVLSSRRRPPASAASLLSTFDGPSIPTIFGKVARKRRRLPLIFPRGRGERNFRSASPRASFETSGGSPKAQPGERGRAQQQRAGYRVRFRTRRRPARIFSRASQDGGGNEKADSGLDALVSRLAERFADVEQDGYRPDAESRRRQRGTEEVGQSGLPAVDADVDAALDLRPQRTLHFCPRSLAAGNI